MQRTRTTSEITAPGGASIAGPSSRTASFHSRAWEIYSISRHLALRPHVAPDFRRHSRAGAPIFLRAMVVLESKKEHPHGNGNNKSRRIARTPGKAQDLKRRPAATVPA